MSNHIVHIPLPTFSTKVALGLRNDLFASLKNTDVRTGIERKPVFQNPQASPRLAHILESLWIHVAEPILDYLDNAPRVANDVLQRVTWCTTGPLVFLPLHAAGRYDSSEPRVFDRAISSYTSTLSALLKPYSDSAKFDGILAVGQAATMGLPPLPGVVEELKMIRLQAKRISFTQIEGEHATSKAVLTGLEEHSWVHLACHASQSPSDPSASAFHLHNSKLDLSTIVRKSLQPKGLAFLSACQTATGDEKLSEEAVHLAAGMIMAGYSTVIGSMWSIQDLDAPLVAEGVYAHLLKDEVPDVRNAGAALHFAVGSLRAKIGEQEFARWVPYVHIGL